MCFQVMLRKAIVTDKRERYERSYNCKECRILFRSRRAVDMVYAEAKKDNRVFTLGPIIHNEQVVKDLEKKV